MSSNLDVSPPPVTSGGDVEPPRPEPDAVRGRIVVAVSIATAVVTACGVWVAWEIAGAPSKDERTGRWGAPRADVQAIEMSLLPRSDAALDRREQPEHTAGGGARGDEDVRRRLSSYGHSDRGRGTVHIPLERAKQLYLERERSRSAAMQSEPAPRRAR